MVSTSENITPLPKKCKTVLYITPSKKNIQNLRNKIKKVFHNNTNALEIIKELNPILRGWGYYYRYANSKRTYNSIRHFIYLQSKTWINKIKGKKSIRKLISKYLINDKGTWEFQVKRDTKTYALFNIIGVTIYKHTLIRNLNPYLKENEEYFKDRIQKEWGRNLPALVYKLVKLQNFICNVCKTPLVKNNEEELEVHHKKAKSLGGTDKISNLLVLHKTCHTNVTNCNDPKLKAKYIQDNIIVP